MKALSISLALLLAGCTKAKPEPAPDIHYFYTVCLDQLYADLPNDGNKEQAEEANRQFEKCLKTAGIRK